MTTPITTETSTKPGWQTSEFWVTAVTSIIVLLNSAFGWNIDPVTLASVAGMVAAYVLARFGTKAAIAKSSAPIPPTSQP